MARTPTVSVNIMDECGEKSMAEANKKLERIYSTLKTTPEGAAFDYLKSNVLHAFTMAVL